MQTLQGIACVSLVLLAQFTTPLRVPPPAVVSGGPSYAGINCQQAQSGSSLGLSCTLSGVAAGSAIYIMQTHQQDANFTAITDSAGTPTLISGTSIVWATSNGTAWSSAYKVENAASGSHVVSMVCSSFCGYNDMSAYVFTGVPASSTTESGVASSGTGAPPTCSSVTTSSANEVVLAYSWVYDGGYTINAGSGYTALPDAVTYAVTEYALKAPAATYAPTWGGSSTGDPVMCLAFAVK